MYMSVNFNDLFYSSLIKGMFHPSHSRGRRERLEYEEYSLESPREVYPPNRDIYGHNSREMYHAHNSRDMYPREQDHMHDPDDYHSPHRASSRRALNAI